MRALALVLAASSSLSLGCARRAVEPSVPPSALHPAPRSALMREVDELVRSLAAGDVGAIARRMTPSLRARLSVTALRAAAERLRRDFGEPRGIMEEHVQREGSLVWYSGLVVHDARGPDARVRSTPVLYQLAFDAEHRLDRALVRQHWFANQLAHPADDYVPITRLHLPATGAWTVAQGGPTRELNAHHGSARQRFAYDLVLVVDGRFRRPSRAGPRNDAYFGYGRPLLAPAAGTVMRVVDGVPDNVPPQRGRAGGNGVVIDHGFGEVSALWHARPGSVRVKAGDHVEPGQVVAEVGNSGASTGAHIHLHLTLDERLALPAPFVDLWVDGAPVDRALPIRGERVEGRLTAERAAPTRGKRAEGRLITD